VSGVEINDHRPRAVASGVVETWQRLEQMILSAPTKDRSQFATSVLDQTTEDRLIRGTLDPTKDNRGHSNR
jgi:hypothetical protein